MPPQSVRTHVRTSLLNCCRLPRNSPIICLLSPFLSRMNRAMPTGVSDTKPLSIRYWIPFSGFLWLKLDFYFSYKFKTKHTVFPLVVYIS